VKWSIMEVHSLNYQCSHCNPSFLTMTSSFSFCKKIINHRIKRERQVVINTPVTSKIR